MRDAARERDVRLAAWSASHAASTAASDEAQAASTVSGTPPSPKAAATRDVSAYPVVAAGAWGQRARPRASKIARADATTSAIPCSSTPASRIASSASASVLPNAMRVSMAASRARSES